MIYIDNQLFCKRKKLVFTFAGGTIKCYKFPPLMRREDGECEKGFDCYLLGYPHLQMRVEVFASFAKLGPKEYKRLKCFYLSGNRSLENLMFEYFSFFYLKKHKGYTIIMKSSWGKNYYS